MSNYEGSLQGIFIDLPFSWLLTQTLQQRWNRTIQYTSFLHTPPCLLVNSLCVNITIACFKICSVTVYVILWQYNFYVILALNIQQRDRHLSLNYQFLAAHKLETREAAMLCRTTYISGQVSMTLSYDFDEMQ